MQKERQPYITPESSSHTIRILLSTQLPRHFTMKTTRQRMAPPKAKNGESKLPFLAVTEIDPRWYESCGPFVHEEVKKSTGDFEGVNVDSKVSMIHLVVISYLTL